MWKPPDMWVWMDSSFQHSRSSMPLHETSVATDIVTDSCEFQGTCCMLCTCYNNVQCFKTPLQFRGTDSIFKLHVCSGVSPSRGWIWPSVTAADECCPSEVLERSFWVCTHTVCTLLQAHIRQQFNSSCLTVGILCNLLIMNDICS